MLECCLRIGFFFKLSFHIKTAVLVTYQSEQFTPSLKAYQAEFKYFTVVGFDKTSTVRLGSLDPFYIVSYYIKWAKTSWSYRTTYYLSKKSRPTLFSTVQYVQEILTNFIW